MAAYLRMNGLDYALGPGVTIVGRDRRTCDVVVPHDDMVSTIHAYVVALPEGRWLLLDAKSSNGTWVDGQRIEEAMLADGMRLVLGNTRVVARVGVGDVAPDQVPDMNLGRLRSGTAQLLPDPARMQVEASRSAFDQLRGLQNACLELATAVQGPGERLERLAELTWALLGPGVVLVLAPGSPREAWTVRASEPESCHRVELPVWARTSWPAAMRDATDRARIIANLERLAGPIPDAPHRDRLVKPVVVPDRAPSRGRLVAAVEVTRPRGATFPPAEGQLLDDLCLAAGVGLARREPR